MRSARIAQSLALVGALAMLVLSLTANAASAEPNCGVQEPGASPAAEKLVNDACTKIGVDYSWGGGHGPQPGETLGICDPANGAPNDCHVTGFDCSGFSRWAYASAAGNDLLTGGTAANQYKILGSGPDIPFDQVKAGDLLYYGSSAGAIHHVAIALGGGYIVEALESGTKIHVSTSYAGHGDLFAAKRPLP
jgi:cell wall-associated NlpC family hydrolase